MNPDFLFRAPLIYASIACLLGQHGLQLQKLTKSHIDVQADMDLAIMLLTRNCMY